MKLLLTSAGIKNNSIRNALVDMLGKPLEQFTALFIPTAAHPLGPFLVWRATQDFIELDWKEFGVLELTALPSIRKEDWLPKLQAADALLVGGGDPLYLCYWMQQSGLADLLPGPSLRETVYVGLSAGSLVMAPNIGEDFVRWKPPTGGDSDGDSDRTLGLVDFAMYPHLDHEALPENTMANAEKWAAGLTVPGYAIDDQTALKVTDGTVEVVSEGHWKLFTPLGEGHLVSEGNFTLDIFYRSWKDYQDTLKQAIAPLTPEQLALRAVPDLRSVGEIVAHVISSRVHWFGDFLGEMSTMPGVESLLTRGRNMPDAPPRTADELVKGLDTSWRFMADRLNRWDSADMQHTFPFDSNGNHYDNSRSWVTWHIIEHDLHHGGEISITLGMYGLQTPDV